MAEEATAGFYPAETLAALFEITPRRVRMLAKEGVLPRESRGKFPLADSVKAYCRYLRSEKRSGPAADEDCVSLNAERALLAKAQRQTAEMELAQRAKMLIPAAEAEIEISSMAKTFAAFLETLADALERDVGLPPEAVERVQQMCDEYRERLYRQMTV